MDLIYQNLDGLDLSFQGIFPELFLQELEEAKQQAQEQRAPVPLTLGRTAVMLSETGMKGGYTYRFDTGHDGEVWGISRSNKIDCWNIFVSVHSEALAIYGYEAVKNRLLNRLQEWGALGVASPSGGLLERINRFDYCFDFVTNRFEPLAERFIAHQHCKKQSYGRQTEDRHITSRGEVIDTLRIGKMPNRQVTIYNKTKEIIDRGASKRYWWKVWPSETVKSGQQVWRLEVRAGKTELDKWGLKRFEDFERLARDVLLGIMKSIRYVEPDGTLNRSRWPMAPFYQRAYEAVQNGLRAYISHADRQGIMQERLEETASCHEKNILGNAIGLAALMGASFDDLPHILINLAQELSHLPSPTLDKMERKLNLAKAKYRVLEG